MASLPPNHPMQGREQWRQQREAWRQQQRMAREQWKIQRAQMKAEWRANRSRGSILGPLILISLGAVFLLTSLHQINGFDVWMGFGHWWSLMLVLAGVILLAEWGIDEYHHNQHPDSPHVRRGIGGGVVFLLIMLTLAGLSASGTRHVNWNWLHDQMGQNDNDDLNHWFGDEHDSDQTANYALPNGGSVSIENPQGDVIVTGTSSDGQVHLQMHKTVYTSSAPDDGFKRLTPQTVSGSSNLDLRMPRLDFGHASMTATVPAGSAVYIQAGRGDVHVSGVNANVNVVSDHGDVAVDGLAGAATIAMKNGDLSAHNIHGDVTVTGSANNATLSQIDGTVSLDGNFGSDVHAEEVRGAFHYHSLKTALDLQRINGNIELGSGGVTGSDLLGPVVLVTKSRNVELQRVSGTVSVKDSNANIELTALQPLGNIDVTTSQGSIDLTVPTHSNFSIDAATQGNEGDVIHDFEDSGLHLSKIGNRTMLTGNASAGGAQIRLSTSHDNITLHKGSNLGTLPAMPSLPAIKPLGPVTPRIKVTKPSTVEN
jgi:hypothetical protein